MTAGECPSEDQLVRMVEGALSSDSLVGIEAHINTCELCMAVVSGLGALNEPPKARVVERYQLDRKIGGGGMGEVWAAWDPKLRREVAVKLVRPDRADDGKERARLLREAQALARLTHPNVVAVHDVGEIDGEVFIATELVAGDTLASRGGASVPWKTIVGLYAQAARGLAAAHAAGLVHRDVKPSNLLLGVDGRVRVADFGLAVRADSNRPPPSPVAVVDDAARGASGLSVTETGHVAGTPAYMAPEQRAGDPPEAPADQFALCVALGEAIAGRRPPIAVTRDAMLQFVTERRLREPGLDELCAVIARGTSIEPGDRFPDMATLAGLLEKLAGTRAPASVEVGVAPASPSPASTVRLRPRPSERVRATAARKIAVAVGLLAAAGGTTAFMLRDRGVAPSAPSPDDTADLVVAGAAPHLDAGALTIDASDRGSASIVDGGALGEVERPARRATTRRAPPTRVADADPPGGAANGAGPSTNTGGASAGGVTMEDVARAIRRRDGKACRAALAQLASPPSTDFRVASLHATCEMVAGNCAGGTREQRALLVREGSPPGAADITADLYCPLTDDPGIRLRRLQQQIATFETSLDCDAYLPPLRASARLATTDRDRAIVGTLLAKLAKCYSTHGDCATARGVLGEAQVFIPALAPNELAAACR